MKKRLFKKLFGVGFIKILSMPLSLAVSIILARSLGAAEFGQYTFAMALLPLIALPVSGGLPQLLTRTIAQYRYEENWSYFKGVVFSGYLWILFLTLLLGFSYWVLSKLGLIPVNDKWALLPYVILLVPLLGLNALRDGVLKGLKQPLWSALPQQILLPLCVLAIVITLLGFGEFDKESAIRAQILAMSLVFLFSTYVIIKKSPVRLSLIKAEYKKSEWLVSLLPLSLISVVSVFNVNVGLVLLGVLGSDESVAAMRIAERGAQFISMPLLLIGGVLSPFIVEAWKCSDIKKLKELARWSSRTALALSFPVFVIFIFWGEALIDFAFGNDYGEIAYLPLIIVSFGQLINVFFGLVAMFLVMTGHERFTLLGQTVALIVNIMGCVILIPIYGAVGAAIGVAVGLLLWNILLLFLLVKHVGVKTWAI